MALLGSAVLAIWNGVGDGFDDEFLKWHVHEHIADRVALPGFLRARRYVAVDGQPVYFNFYEAVSVRDLSSAAYQRSLNHPSRWTRQVVQHFVETSRTTCTVSLSEGCGTGALVETLRLETRLPAGQFERQMIEDVLTPVTQQPGVVGTHLLHRYGGQSVGHTAEAELRASPDQTADWIVLVETVGETIVAALRDDLLGNPKLMRAGCAPDIRRGLYSLQFSLARSDPGLGWIGRHTEAAEMHRLVVQGGSTQGSDHEN